MKLDSEKQRRLLLSLIGRVPVQTTIAELFNGVDPDIVELVKAIREATVDA